MEVGLTDLNLGWIKGKERRPRFNLELNLEEDSVF